MSAGNYAQLGVQSCCALEYVNESLARGELDGRGCGRILHPAATPHALIVPRGSRGLARAYTTPPGPDPRNDRATKMNITGRA